MTAWFFIFVDASDSVKAYPFEDKSQIRNLLKHMVDKNLTIFALADSMEKKLSSLQFSDLKEMRKTMLAYQSKYNEKYEHLVIMNMKTDKIYYAEDVENSKPTVVLDFQNLMSIYE